MNEIINRFLLAGDKSMPEMDLRFGFGFNLPIVLANHLLKPKKEYKNLKKQEIQDIFIKTNWTKLALNMIRLMEILKISLEEQLLIKY